MDTFLDLCRSLVRRVVRHIARFMNTMTRGRLHPNVITWIGLIAHVPISYVIARGYFGYAAIGLVVFGLFDALDGELARLQNRASAHGMLLDATTDRMKEVMLYTGTALAAINFGRPAFAAWSVIACGASLCVSYVKAKGETAVRDSGLSANQINRLFQDGLGRFEVRMFILVIGLLTSYVSIAVIVIALLSIYTAFERLIRISRRLM